MDFHADMPFRDLVGHRRLLGLLARSVAHASLPPSLIFSGPEGVGKRRVALATAQALNCQSPIVDVAGSRRPAAGSRQSAVSGRIPNPESRIPNPESRVPSPEFDSCGTCPACGRIARGTHPDVRTLAPGETGSIKIEEVREAIESAAYRPFEGRRRVFIIEEADALVGAAQNALLKTLEEPRPSSVFMLVSARADALLPTVQSRCSRLRFGRLTIKEVADVLMRAHRYAEQDARAAAALSDGSVARALALRAAEYAGARQVAFDLLSAVSGSADARTRLERAKSLTGRSGRGGAGGTGGPRTDREQVAIHLQALSSLLRDVGILATGADRQWLANLDVESGLTTLTRHFDGRLAVRAFTAVDRAQDALERNVSPKVVADWLSLQL